MITSGAVAATVIDTAIDATMNLEQNDCENTINAPVADKAARLVNIVMN